MHETTVIQPFQTMRDSQFPRDGKHTRGALQLAQLPSLPGSKGERPQHSRANSLSWEDRAKGLGRPRWPALAGQSAGEETVTQRCGDLQGVSPWSFQHDWLMSVRDPPAPPPPRAGERAIQEQKQPCAQSLFPPATLGNLVSRGALGRTLRRVFPQLWGIGGPTLNPVLVPPANS